MHLLRRSANPLLEASCESVWKLRSLYLLFIHNSSYISYNFSGLYFILPGYSILRHSYVWDVQCVLNLPRYLLMKMYDLNMQTIDSLIS